LLLLLLLLLLFFTIIIVVVFDFVFVVVAFEFCFCFCFYFYCYYLQAAEVQQEAALLLGRLSLSEACKGAIRGHFGIVTLLKMLDRHGLDRSSKEVVVRTLSILAVDNEVNQDHIRCAVAEVMYCLCVLCCIWCLTMHITVLSCRVNCT